MSHRRIVQRGAGIQELSARQIEMLKRKSPTADDILENDEYLSELREEIAASYDQGKIPSGDIIEQPVLAAVIAEQKPPVEIKNTESRSPKMSEYNPEAELDAMLEAVKAAPAPVREEPVEEEVDPETTRVSQIRELLNTCQDAPSDQQIAQWKHQHGENGVHATAFGEGEAYVFTYLRRGAWQKIQNVIQQAVEKQTLANKDPDAELKEKVLQFCILYPRPLGVEFFYNSRAGTIDTLFDLIMLHSHFLNTQQAMMLTTQL